MNANDYKKAIIKLLKKTEDTEKLQIIYRIIRRYLD